MPSSCVPSSPRHDDLVARGGRAGSSGSCSEGSEVAPGRRPRRLPVHAGQSTAARRGSRRKPRRADPAHPEQRIGVVKAYTTPSAASCSPPPSRTNAVGERIRRRGQGIQHRHRPAATVRLVRRRRRTAFYSARISGSTEIALMLLDVLSGLGRTKASPSRTKRTHKAGRSRDARPPRRPGAMCRPAMKLAT